MPLPELEPARSIAEIKARLIDMDEVLDNINARTENLGLLREAFGLLLAGAIGNPLDKAKVDDVLKRLGYVPLSPLLVPGN